MIIRAATVDDLPAIALIQSRTPESAQWDPTDYLQYDCRVVDVVQDACRADPLVRAGRPRPAEAGQGAGCGPGGPPHVRSGQPVVIVGFLVTRETAPCEREILNLAVDAEHRRQGIARALLQHALAGVHADWYLEVRQSNTAAIGLYCSLGFEQVALRPAYYTDPSEPGIVMKLRS